MDYFYFRIFDCVYGSVIALSIFTIFRVSIARQHLLKNVRYSFALSLLFVTILAVVYLFLDDYDYLNINGVKAISWWADILVAGSSILMLLLIIRNRNIYPVKFVSGAITIIGILLVCYILCMAFHFADWTYIAYMFCFAILLLFFGFSANYLISHIPSLDQIMQRDQQKADQMSVFRVQLNDILYRDELYSREDLTRDFVCKKMHTNRTTFSRQLKLAYGKTFREHLRDVRLLEAAKLLRDTDMPIDQIAFQVGLKSVSGFYRNFLLTYGVTPTVFRQQNKELTSRYK